MKAVVCEELGSVVLREVPDPVAGPGQVVVRVEAAGVNYVDGLIVRGAYQLRPPLPFTPGSEVAGRLDDGTRVLAFCMFGGFAEQVVVHRDQAVRVPDRIDSARAAGFVQSYCTAAYALRRRARMEPGERVLVLGAGGGVGLAAIQLAKAYGGQVLAAASTPEKRKLAAQAGADETIGYEELKQAARGFGVDITVDPIGGELSEQALRGMREGGRLLVIGFAGGAIPRLPANQVLLRNRSVVGVDWGAWAVTHAGENRALLEELLLLDGLDPVAPETRPLAGAGQAMDDLIGRRITGKLVLVPSS
ncbi:NADPH:quinone oxidoreductase family protein [Nonomuraea soli]|uniref:NADPH2:quinone reductase n=1 Tax=Nonomuraea soli TaxID=1032476 RepID=A0A7W0HVT7_9ACTN|nr:NADPH:quinone oxidoreductase family protein [Nonomuraea soli]MBA2897533.1 NADPH2:quinone reductase [Nonomuraea soli]